MSGEAGFQPISEALASAQACRPAPNILGALSSLVTSGSGQNEVCRVAGELQSNALRFRMVLSCARVTPESGPSLFLRLDRISIAVIRATSTYACFPKNQRV